MISVLAGAAILAAQNGLLFGGFLVWLGDNEDGFRIGSASLLLDALGMALLGLGIVRMMGEARTADRRTGPESVCGILLLAWPVLTVLWRWGVPALHSWDYIVVFDAILESDGGMPSSLEGGALAVWLMLFLWAAASLSLMAAALMLRLQRARSLVGMLLEKRMDLRSWEGFATLNAFGTVVVVGGLWSILAGGSGGGLLTAGIALKVILIPFNGVFAYGFLAYRAWTAMGRWAPEKAPDAPVATPAASEELPVDNVDSSHADSDRTDPDQRSLPTQEFLE